MCEICQVEDLHNGFYQLSTDVGVQFRVKPLFPFNQLRHQQWHFEGFRTSYNDPSIDQYYDITIPISLYCEKCQYAITGYYASNYDRIESELLAHKKIHDYEAQHMIHITYADSSHPDPVKDMATITCITNDCPCQNKVTFVMRNDLYSEANLLKEIETHTQWKTITDQDLREVYNGLLHARRDPVFFHFVRKLITSRMAERWCVFCRRKEEGGCLSLLDDHLTKTLFDFYLEYFGGWEPI